MQHFPLFIVFEGIDGSGKSTQAAKLHEYIAQKCREAFLGMEPTNGPYGQQIRNILQGEELPDARRLADLFILDRKENVNQNIKSRLSSGIPVILDRYYLSNAAYQGAMGLNPVAIVKENIAENFPRPDRVYLIDIPIEKALERIGRRNQGSKSDLFEKKKFLTTVREIYLSLADERFVIINGDQREDDVFSDILKDYKNRGVS